MHGEGKRSFRLAAALRSCLLKMRAENLRLKEKVKALPGQPLRSALSAAQGWHEIWLWEEEARSLGAASSVAEGHSILVLPAFSTPEVCSTLHEYAVLKADGRGFTRIINDDIESEIKEPFDAIILKLFDFLEVQMPELSLALFGQHSVREMHIEFSVNEPALNVYAVGGKIGAHEDGFHLSFLLPTSPNDEFVGGGTGFWSDENYDHSNPGTQPPTMVLRPPPGTGIIFAGETIHSAHPVLSGIRSCFVATFNLFADANDLGQCWS